MYSTLVDNACDPTGLPCFPRRQNTIESQQEELDYDGEAQVEKRVSFSKPLSTMEAASIVSEEIDVDEYEEPSAVTKSEERTPLLSRRNLLRVWVGLVVIAAVLLITILPRNKSNESETPPVVSNIQEEEEVVVTEGPTLAPTSELELTVQFQVLEPVVSNPDSLLDPSTPQGQAFLQLLTEPVTEDPSFRIQQRFAMMTLFFAMGGDAWAWNFGWSTFESEECSWHGVAICRYRDGRRVVTGIQMPSNDISGEIPEEICLLKDLESLLLGNNEIVGNIPACVTELNSLLEFDVHNNDLVGTPPQGFLGMEKLVRLDLSDNDFSGTLDFLIDGVDIGSSEVDTLKLNNNAFTGDVPADLFLLDNLEQLTLHKNALLGDVSSFCDKGPLSTLTADCSQVACSSACCTCF